MDMGCGEGAHLSHIVEQISSVSQRKIQGIGIDIDWEYPVEGGEDDNIHRPEDLRPSLRLRHSL